MTGMVEEDKQGQSRFLRVSDAWHVMRWRSDGCAAGIKALPCPSLSPCWHTLSLSVFCSLDEVIFVVYMYPFTHPEAVSATFNVTLVTQVLFAGDILAIPSSAVTTAVRSHFHTFCIILS